MPALRAVEVPQHLLVNLLHHDRVPGERLSTIDLKSFNAAYGLARSEFVAEEQMSRRAYRRLRHRVQHKVASCVEISIK